MNSPLMTTMVIIFMNPPLILQNEQRAVHPSSVPKWTGAYPVQHVLQAVSANIVVQQGTHLNTSKGQWWEGLSPKNLDVRLANVSQLPQAAPWLVHGALLEQNEPVAQLTPEVTGLLAGSWMKS